MAGVECDTEDMVCPLCREIYRSPRFLVGCYHTFCCECIDKHANSKGTNDFPCPICREVTYLPKGGAVDLQVNFYFKEETLAEARRVTSKNCTYHETRVIDRVCLPCATPACPECNHQGKDHRVLELAAARTAMEEQVAECQDQRALKEKQLAGLQAKTSALSRQLRQQRDLLHARVDQQFKMNNRYLWKVCHNQSEKLVAEIQHLKKEERTSRNLYGLSKQCQQDPAILGLLDIAKRIQQRLHDRVDYSVVSPHPVPHPGLTCPLPDSQLQDTLHKFLGVPCQHPAPDTPLNTPQDEVFKVPLKIGKPKEIHEILSLAPSNDGLQVLVCFRGEPAHLYSSVVTVQTEDGALLSADHNVMMGRGVCVHDYSKLEMAPGIAKTSYFGVFLLSKTLPRLCLYRTQFGGMRLYQAILSLVPQSINRHVPVHEAQADSFLVEQDLVQPFNFDVSCDTKYYAVIDLESEHMQPLKKRKLDEGVEGVTEDINDQCIQQPPVGALLKLFHKNKPRAVDIYRASNPSFLPSDVCFCHFGKKRRLVVADWQNDEVHLLRISKKAFHFERLLAHRDGELVKPTAVNTDQEGGVWVGCSNGNLLRINTTV